MNASGPSLASCEPSTFAPSGFWSSQSSASVRPWVARISCFDTATASGAFFAMLSGFAGLAEAAYESVLVRVLGEDRLGGEQHLHRDSVRQIPG